MLKYGKLLLLFITIALQVNAKQKERQNIWHLLVVDSISTKGIAGATIMVNNLVFISDVTGKVDIDKKIIGADGNLKVSCVGYQTKKLKPGRGGQFPDTIKLLALVIALKEVSVVGPRTEMIGAIQKVYNTHRVPNPSTSHLQFIPNINKVKGIITTVTYVLNDELHGIDKPFRLRLFSKTKGSLKPDKELIADSVVVYNPRRDRVANVDITKYSVGLPEDGVIAVFETLSPSAYGTDTVWYSKPPQGHRWYLKMPGIEMDLNKKDSYLIDYNKDDRTTAYSAIGPPANYTNLKSIWHQWYVFADGNNFAITITIQPTSAESKVLDIK